MEPIEELKAMIAAATNAAEKKELESQLKIKELEAANEEFKTSLEASEKLQTKNAETIGKLDTKLIEIEANTKRMIKQSETPLATSIGGLFIKSDAFGNGGADLVGKTVILDTKDISSGGASAGALVRPDRDPTVYMNPNRPTRIRDLINSIPTSSNAVEVMRENVFTNNAAIQAGELATKGQSELTYELVTYPVRTMAHFVRASRQILDDAAQLSGLIDNRLPYGLDLLSDAQLLSGDGTGNNLTGLLVDADVSTVGEIASGTAAGDVPAAMIDHIRSAVTTCQTFEYYNTNGIVLNPVDWETLETAKATDGNYLMISMPQDGSVERIWRMPVVVTNAMPADNFLLGDWTMGANIYDREQTTIRISESDGTDFVQNAIKVLGEERYAFAVPLPKAFCKGLFTVAP